VDCVDLRVGPGPEGISKSGLAERSIVRSHNNRVRNFQANERSRPFAGGTSPGTRSPPDTYPLDSRASRRGCGSFWPRWAAITDMGLPGGIRCAYAKTPHQRLGW